MGMLDQVLAYLSGQPNFDDRWNALANSGTATVNDQSPMAVSNPWAVADAALAKKRNFAWNPGTPAIPFAGMLNNTGTFNPGSFQAQPMTPGTAAPALPDPVNVAAVPQPPNLQLGHAQPQDFPSIPAASQASQQVAQPPSNILDQVGSGIGGFLDKVRPHALTLLALGSGLAGAPSLGTGISRAAAAAVPAASADMKMQMQMQGIQQTYKALVAQGVPPQEALAAVYNPDVLKAMIPRLYGKTPEWKQVGVDEYGNPKYGWVNAAYQTVTPASSITVPRVSSFEDALRLPKGTHFIDPNGVERVR